MMKRAMLALGAVVWAMSLTACVEPECKINSDCENNGTCNEGVCEPDNRPMTCTSGRVTCAADEVCDTDGECKTCTLTQGCSAPEFCDTAANDGAGRCVICTDAAANCGDETPICNEAANGGAGQCVTCTAEVGCLQGTCDTEANGGAGRCVTCTGDEQCTDGDAPFCDVESGTCIACKDSDPAGGQDEGCTEELPFCGANNTCAACVDIASGTAQDQGCSEETPICDTVTVTCREPTCEEDSNYCPACTDNTMCAATQTCTDAGECGAPVTAPADSSAQIAAVLAAAIPGGGAPLDPAMPIRGALVTYLQPASGTDGNAESVGFYLQAQDSGPAIFVAIDPASLAGGLAVGDRVDLDVEKIAFSKFTKDVTVAANVTIVSRGHPVGNLNTDTTETTGKPAGLKVNHSATSPIGGNTNNNAALEAELTFVTGTVTGAFKPALGTMMAAQFVTTGTGSNTADVFVRLPKALVDGGTITAGCTVSLASAVVHGYFEQAFFSAYDADDVSVTDCPAPTVRSANATDATTVQVTFTRPLDENSVDAADFAITDGTNALAVSAVAVAGNVATLTTDAQSLGTSYTVTVTGVDDVSGTAIGGSNTATFAAFDAAAWKLLINEVDVDMPTAWAPSDNREFIELYNAGPGPAPLAGIQVVLVNGNGGGAATYLTITLNAVTDGAGDPATSLPAGGYLVLASADTLTAYSDPSNQLIPPTAYRMAITGGGGSATDIIQNGDPDGIVLFDSNTNEPLDVLQYEAASVEMGNATINSVPVPMKKGTASVKQIEDVGNESSLQRHPNGSDTGSTGNDWMGADFTLRLTPGSANVFP